MPTTVGWDDWVDTEVILTVWPELTEEAVVEERPDEVVAEDEEPPVGWTEDM